MATRRTRKTTRPTSAGGCYRIGMVARLTGLSTHTLRAWERRYESIVPGRMSSGARLYDDADVARLRLLRVLTEQGHAIGSIASLSPEALEQLAARARDPAEHESPAAHVAAFRARFLEAITAFDLAAAARVLTQVALLVTPRELVTDVLGPLFRELGVRWEEGTLTVAHEHAASALLRSELGMLLRSMRVAPGGPTVIATTLPGEQHEFGALLAALMSGAQGAHVVYLGSNLPIADIATTADAVDADFVLVSVVNVLDDEAADSLTELARALPRDCTLCVGGRGVPTHPHLGRTIRHLQSLDALEQLLG